jgi:acetylornithine deacetylase
MARTPLGTVGILERLVACPTVSRDPNLPLIDWVRNFLADQGIDSCLVPDATGRKSNLIASIGPAAEGGLVLSGHTDVVPVEGQDWRSDPFTLTARGSRLHARGACDMKGFIAVALARLETWKRLNLARPVHLTLSYDEELGCLGAPSMIAAAQGTLRKPGAVIVGEPTSMRVANTHKGLCIVRTRVTGVEAHSSLTHQGVSAVMLAGELIGYLAEISRTFARNASTAGYGVALQLPHTTLSVNRIEGGTAVNILAAACEFDWDIRTVAGEAPSAILRQVTSFTDARLAELLKAGKRASVQMIVTADVPPLRADGGDAEKLAAAVALEASEPISVPFATEAGQFQCAGWPTVVCGPGSIDQAHKPDEFIERSELTACERFLDRAVRYQCQRQ